MISELEIDTLKAGEFLLQVREELRKLGVTPERTRRIENLPLTPVQVASAIKDYVVKIEKRKKNKV